MMFVSVMLAVSSAAQTKPAAASAARRSGSNCSANSATAQEQQRASERNGTGTGTFHDLADGGAEPALDKIPREGVEREHERQHGKAGGGVQVLRRGVCPRGLGVPQASKTPAQAPAATADRGQRHVVGRALGGEPPDVPKKLNSCTAYRPSSATDQIAAVDKERNGACGIRNGKRYHALQPHGQQRGLDIGASSRAGQRVSPGAKTKQNQQQRRQLTGEQMTCTIARHAQRHRQPIPKRGLSLV